MCVLACRGCTPAHTHFLYGGPCENIKMLFDICCCVGVCVARLHFVSCFFARHVGQPAWRHYVEVSHPLRVQKARVSNYNGFKVHGEAEDLLIAEVNVLHEIFPIK